MPLLVVLHRWSRPWAHYLGPLRPAARRTFRALMRSRYRDRMLASVEQNGRTWKLTPEIALRGALQEFDTIEWFRSVVKPGMTVIDVGANVGQMTLELAHLVGTTGKVLSIEPGEGNLALLKRHVEANGMRDRVELVAAACADVHGGELSFYVAGKTAASVGSGHTLAGADAIRRAKPNTTVHTVRCACVSIDGLCRDRGISPSMIKIDVEGGELKVLEGAKHTLLSARPHLRVGFHPFAFEDARAASDELRALLAAAAYRLVDAPEEGALELGEYVAVPENRGRD